MQKDIHPYLTIVIPTYKDWKRLQLCLDALAMQTYPSECFEVIVINNDPFDNPPENIRLPSNAMVINEGKVGSYAARNRGLQVAKGEIIGFTDSDCIPDSKWLDSALMIFRGANSIDRVGGLVRIYRLPDSSWLVWKFESITAFNQHYNVSKGVSVTANLFVKRSVFDKVGTFNGGVLSGGDMQWNSEATKAGFNIIFSDQVIVMHPARASFKSLVDKSRRIVGGGFFKAKQERRVLLYILRHFIPPLRYAKVLIHDDKPIIDTVLAITIYWLLKLLMIFEISRLCCGGKPQR